MSKRRKDRKGRRGPVRRTTLLTNHPVQSFEKRPSYRQWPVVRAYVPVDEAWRVSGVGQAGIIRRRPDGMLFTSFFDFTLMDGGMRMMYGEDETTEEKVNAFVKDLAEVSPAMDEGPPDLAARFAWGAYALSVTEGYEWPREMSGRYLGLMPPLSGTQNWWLQQFIGDSGLAPPGLWPVIQRLPRDEDIPEDKELVVFTEMEFRLQDPAAAIAVLHTLEPEFRVLEEEGESLLLDYSRAYPKGHWSPLRLLGGRQSLGTVQIEGARMSAQSKVLSMSCAMVTKLKAALGDNMTLETTRWTDPASLMRDVDADEVD